MNFLPNLSCLCALLILSGAVVACDIETTPTAQDLANTDAGHIDDAGKAYERSFVKDPYGIQTSWFDYESSTHAILARERIYRFEKDDETIYFKIDSYYNERGDSGFFSITRHAPGAADIQLALTANIKDAPVCVNLRDTLETDCNTGAHDLIFRVEYRAVAGAGFAVSNPAIYTSSHFVDAAPIELSYGHFDSFEDAASDPARTAWTALEDAKTHPSHAQLYATFGALALGQPSPAILQASANMKLIGWTMEKIAPDKLKLSAHCVRLSATPNAQTLPLSAQARSATLEFDANAVSLVGLCGDDGPAIIEVSSDPYRALWPDTDTYDLVIDTLGETPELRLAAGHYIWSDGSDAVDATSKIPVALWD